MLLAFHQIVTILAPFFSVVMVNSGYGAAISCLGFLMVLLRKVNTLTPSPSQNTRLKVKVPLGELHSRED